MFMPAGTQSISAWQAGKPVAVTVQVDSAAAQAVQQQFEKLSAKSAHKVYFDFDHDDKQASFWPDSFTWREGSGIWCRGTWSAAGLEAVQGKSYRGFSPVFHVDPKRKSPTRVICNPEAELNMGGLVNNPAFKNNLPLWAKDAGATTSSANKNKTPHNMPPKTKAELEAEIQQINTDLAELKAKGSSPENDDAIAAMDADLELAQARLETAIARDELAQKDADLTSIHAADAKTAVDAAIERGVFGPKDNEMISFWTKELTETPSKAAVLAKMPGRVTLGRPSVSASAAAPVKARAGNDAIIGRVQIVRSDIRNVIQSMAGICARQAPGSGLSYEARRAPAKDLAAVYAREIKPRLAEGDDIPLHQLEAITGVASNSLGTLAQTLVAIRSLELLTQELPMLKAFTMDFSDQIVSYGDAINTRVLGLPSAIAYNTSTGFPTPTNTTTTDVTLTFNQWYGVFIQFLGHEMAGTIRSLFDEQADDDRRACPRHHHQLHQHPGNLRARHLRPAQRDQHGHRPAQARRSRRPELPQPAAQQRLLRPARHR